MTDHTALLRQMYDAAVSAAHPDSIQARHLPPPPRGRVICLAAGKGAAAMAAAAERTYLDDYKLPPERLIGIATTRHGHGKPTRRITVIEAGHPVPDEGSLRGADESLKLASEATRDDLLLILLSGGGSANWLAPAEGLAFSSKQQLTRALLRSGANIGEINTVRKHLSRIKGGRLARAGLNAGQILTLAISDVPNDDPAVIASGPTVPDPSTLDEARAICSKYSLTLEGSVAAALADPANESCKADEFKGANISYVMIARPKESIDAAAAIAAKAGYRVINLGADLEGEARDIANQHADLAIHHLQNNARVAIVSGGELTVTIKGNGRGGPNQEYALALAGRFKGISGITALAADTDGADGGGGSASDPAGAVVDQAVLAEIEKLNLEPQAYLDNNDATTFFEKCSGLLHTGPTLTNVNDIRVILVDPPTS